MNATTNNPTTNHNLTTRVSRPKVRAALAVAAVACGVLLGTSAPAQAQVQAYLWADLPSFTYTYQPRTSTQFNLAAWGPYNTVKRNGRGDYTVTLPKLGGSTGHVQVTRHSTLPGACKVAAFLPSSSVDKDIRVLCFDASGAPADSFFTLSFVRPSRPQPGLGFVLAWQPTTSFYTLTNGGYNYNGAGASNTISRLGVGDYQVTLPGVGSTTNAGHVQVTALGTGNARCEVGSWGTTATMTVSARVRCFTPTGAPSDSVFELLYTDSIGLFSTCGSSGSGMCGGYVLAHWPTVASYTPLANYQYNSSGVAATVSRTGVGSYVVKFPYALLDQSIPHVTAVGTNGEQCTIASWSSSNGVQVRCFDRAGLAKDVIFSLMVLHGYYLG